MNDISVLTWIIGFFLLLGFVLPFAHDVQDTPGKNIDTDRGEIESDLSGQDESTTSVWQVLWSVINMYFWTFGNLPVWLDLIMWIPRFVLYLTVARNIWVGGGG